MASADPGRSSDRRLRGRGARRAAVLLVALLAVLAGAVGPVAVARAQEGPADPAVVRDEVRDVMSRPEFSYEPSLLDRIGRWLSDWLDGLFPDPQPGAGGSTFAGGVGALVAWAMVLLAVVGLVVVVVVVLRNRIPKADAHEVESEAEVEHRRRAGEWADDAARLEAEGRWKEALRARYRWLVRTLVDRRQLPDVPGRTTGELRRDLDGTTPGASADFETCSSLFELAWYAGVPVGGDEVARLRSASDAVLAAAPVDRFEGVLLPDLAGSASSAADADGVAADAHDDEPVGSPS